MTSIAGRYLNDSPSNESETVIVTDYRLCNCYTIVNEDSTGTNTDDDEDDGGETHGSEYQS